MRMIEHGIGNPTKFATRKSVILSAEGRELVLPFFSSDSVVVIEIPHSSSNFRAEASPWPDIPLPLPVQTSRFPPLDMSFPAGPPALLTARMKPDQAAAVRTFS